MWRWALAFLIISIIATLFGYFDPTVSADYISKAFFALAILFFVIYAIRLLFK